MTDDELLELFRVLESDRVERLKANGNPPPEFTVEDAHVLATVRPRP